jgi:hypothetical protein
MIPISSSGLDLNEQEKDNFLNEAPVSWWEAFSTGFSANVDKNPFWKLLDNAERERKLEEDPELIPQSELNKNYAGLGLTFYRDEPKGYVETLVKQRLDMMKKESVEARGPQNFFARSSYFIGGIGATAPDPFNLMAAFVPVVGQSSFLTSVAAKGLTKARFTKGIKEGFVGNVAIEPMNVLAAKAEQSEYSAYDSIRNIAFGTILSGGMHVGFGRIGDAYKSVTGKENIYTKLSKADPSLREDMLRHAFAQMAQGKKISMKDFLDQTIIAHEDNIKAAGDALPRTPVLEKFESQKKSILETAQTIDKNSVIDNEIKITETQEQLTNELTKLKEELKVIQAEKIEPIITKYKGKDGEEVTNATYDQTAINAKTKVVGEKVRQIKELQDKINKAPKQNNTLVVLKNKLDVINERIDKEKTKGGIAQYEKNVARRIEEENISLPESNPNLQAEMQAKDVYEIYGEIDRTKKIDSDNIDSLNKESNILKEQDIVNKEQFKDILNQENAKIIDSFDKDISAVDKKINRREDLLTSIKAGISCLVRKGL